MHIVGWWSPQAFQSFLDWLANCPWFIFWSLISMHFHWFTVCFTWLDHASFDYLHTFRLWLINIQWMYHHALLFIRTCHLWSCYLMLTLAQAMLRLYLFDLTWFILVHITHLLHVTNYILSILLCLLYHTWRYRWESKRHCPGGQGGGGNSSTASKTDRGRCVLDICMRQWTSLDPLTSGWQLPLVFRCFWTYCILWIVNLNLTYFPLSLSLSL